MLSLILQLDVLTCLGYIHLQVKDNRDELLRVSNRLQHVMLALEERQRRDFLRPDDYNDALTAISW